LGEGRGGGTKIWERAGEEGRRPGRGRGRRGTKIWDRAGEEGRRSGRRPVGGTNIWEVAGGGTKICEGTAGEEGRLQARDSEVDIDFVK